MMYRLKNEKWTNAWNRMGIVKTKKEVMEHLNRFLHRPRVTVLKINKGQIVDSFVVRGCACYEPSKRAPLVKD